MIFYQAYSEGTQLHTHCCD